MRYVSLPKIEVRLLFATTQFSECVSSRSNVDDDDDDDDVSYLVGFHPFYKPRRPLG